MISLPFILVKGSRLKLTKIILLFIPGTLLVAGGREYPWMPSASYILQLKLKEDEITDAQFIEADEVPYELFNVFYQTCGSRSVIGGGCHGDQKNSSIVLEYTFNKWKFLPSLNEGRSLPGSCWIHNQLVVAGGSYNNGPDYGEEGLDSIEILDFDVSESQWEWETCASSLPIAVQYHTLSLLHDKMYLIGGIENRTWLNKIWKGSFHPNKTFTFEEMPPMKNERMLHFSISVNDKIHVFGGEKDCEQKSIVEIFDGHQWRLGPQLPFNVCRYSEAHAVLTSNNLILIITGDKQIVVYNPTKETISNVFNTKLDQNSLISAALIL